MTLDEAIEHAKEVARTCDDSQRAADHLQLAEWLRQARGAEKGARWLTGKIRKLEAENAQLKEKNEKLMVLVGHLMFVKSRDVTGIMYKGEVLNFDKLLEEVGLRWEDI